MENQVCGGKERSYKSEISFYVISNTYLVANQQSFECMKFQYRYGIYKYFTVSSVTFGAHGCLMAPTAVFRVQNSRRQTSLSVAFKNFSVSEPPSAAFKIPVTQSPAAPDAAFGAVQHFSVSAPPSAAPAIQNGAGTNTTKIAVSRALVLG